MSTIAYDSPSGFATAQQIGPTLTTYPMAGNPVPDIYPRTYQRTYKQTRTAYAPTIADRTSWSNKITYSNDPTNAAWTKTNVNAAASAAYGNPWDGNGSVYTLLETSATDVHKIICTLITVLTDSYTYSAIVRGGLNRSWVKLESAFGSCFFNISDGTVGTAVTCTPLIEPVDGGFYRISITISASIGVDIIQLSLSTDGSTLSYTGTTSYGIYLAQVQSMRGTAAGPLVLTTTATRTISAPDIDAEDSFAYLVEETDPEPTSLGDLVRFNRTHARIPAPQVIPSTRLFDRPNLHDLKSGSTYAVSFDDGITSTLFASRKAATIGAITAQTITATTPVATFPSATVNYKLNGATSSFNLTDSAAAIQISHAQMVSYGGVSKSNTDISIQLKSGGFFEYIECANDAVEISSSGSSVNIGIRQNTTSDSVAAAPNIRTISSTAHGGSAGSRVVAWNGDTIIGTATVLTVATDSLVIPADDGAFAVGTLTISHIEFQANGTTLANGPIRCSAKRTQTYFLPGVSFGITTAADIAPPTVVTDPQSYLAQAVAYLASPANTTYAVHEVSDLTPWRGPILMQEVLSLQLADAIRSV